MTWAEVAERALRELSAEERRDAAVYLDERELPAGSTVEIDRTNVPVRQPSALVFVDRHPRANWGHACRYLLVGLEHGDVESLEAQFPPFLRGVPATLRVVWQGETVPDWAIARP